MATPYLPVPPTSEPGHPDPSDALAAEAAPRVGGLREYVAIARLDHWFKNVLVLPGTLVAAMVAQASFGDYAAALLLGLFSTCLIASANYALNEWLDAPFDRFHPLKRYRPSVATKLDPRIVWGEYAALTLGGLGLGLAVSPWFCAVVGTLWLQGLAYNVAPMRTKDRVFVDVLSESINNPIRLLLGWLIVMDSIAPPASLLLGYWALGAFLMAIKRYAEMRFIGSPETAALYRRSFRHYTETNLMVSAMFYAFASSFCFAAFILKYRLELVLTLPFVAAAFAWYVAVGMKSESAAQTPERLYREPGFFLYLAFVAALMIGAFAVDVPALDALLANPFTAIR